MERKASLLTAHRDGAGDGRPALKIALVLLLGAAFLAAAVGWSERYERRITRNYEATRAPLLPGSDYSMFYAGTQLVRAGDNEKLYDLPTLVRRILIVRGYDPAGIDAEPDPYTSTTRWLRYYNPPFFLFALTPLTYLDLHTSYLLIVGVNIVLLVFLAAALAEILNWRQPESALIMLALAGFVPAYFTLEHGQPTILIALLLALGYLALRRGWTVLAAVLLALTSIKPNWLLPAIAALKPEPRLRLPFIVALAALMLLPFVLLGPGTLIDYVQLITARGSDDLSDPVYAGALLSWAGFFRALLGEPHPELWFIASLVTGAVFLLLWRRAGTALALCGGVLAGLIVVPHSHPQDWMLVAPVAAILLQAMRPWSHHERLAVTAGLLALYFGTNDWQTAQQRMDETGSSIFWSTPIAFALLCFLAWRSKYIEKVDLP